MARCFLTGVDLVMEKAFVLDKAEAYRAARGMRNKLAALEKLIADLGVKEKVEFPDKRTGKIFSRFDSRLVCETVASALSATCAERKLFVRWPEWKASQKARLRDNKSKGNNDAMENNKAHNREPAKESSGNGNGA